MGRVLIIEGDADLRVLLARAIEGAGHETFLAANGRAGLDLARSLRPDAILLDAGLPDVAGIAVARSLATDLRTSAIPFLIVSAKAGERERIEGLEAGADDFIAKPFSARELVLRVQVALRRGARAQIAAPSSLLEHPPISLDRIERRAYVGGRPIPLTPTEFRLLLTLASQPDTAHSRESLLGEVWGLAPSLETRTVDAHVTRLREKLEDAGAMIETVRGVGYKMAPARIPESVSERPRKALRR